MAESRKLTLYFAPSVCSLAVHITLRHLAIPFDTVPLAFKPRPDGGRRGLTAADGSFSHDDYSKIHPKSKVPGLRIPVSLTTGAIAPALSYDDESSKAPRKFSGAEALSLDNAEFLTELPAVLDYITGLTPEGARFLGPDALSRARVWEWVAWMVGHVQAIQWSNLVGPTEEIRARGLEGTRAAFDRMSAHLETKKFVVGDGLTLADIMFYTWYRIGHLFEGIVGDMQSQWPILAEHVKRVEELQVVRDAVEYEGLKLAVE